MSGVVYGVIGGLITAAVIWVIKSSLPRLVDQVFHRGIHIDGVWEIIAVKSCEEIVVGQITLQQVGRRITGFGERWQTREGKDSNRKFKYSGRLAGEQLTLIFQDVRGEDFDCGTYVFRVQNSGVEMIGMSTFHGKNENRIVSEERKLRKKAI
jgi:hypothetical protein